MSDQEQQDSIIPQPIDPNSTEQITLRPIPAAGSKKEKFFDTDLVKRYPRSNRRLSLNVAQFGIKAKDEDFEKNGHSVYISPHGIEFKTAEKFEDGQLLKIHVALPDYWSRKQKLVNYGRIDSPNEFRVLAKVVRSEDVGKRGKKKLVTVQTIIMDEVDEQVLKNFLQEG